VTDPTRLTAIRSRGVAPPAEPPAPPPGEALAAAEAASPPPPPGSAPGSLRLADVRSALNIGALRPDFADLVRPTTTLPPLPPPPPPEPIADRTFTQLVNDAIVQLRGAPRDTLGEAIRTLQAKGLKAGEVMDLIERRTRVGEVLGASSSRWSAETVADFAAMFQMDATKLGAMDVIVALAVLNDAEFEAELRLENLPPTTPQDLLQNRKVVFQYPPPGTELTPPYVILVAVEHQDFAQAEQIVAGLLGQLTPAHGFRMPRDAAARLG